MTVRALAGLVRQNVRRARRSFVLSVFGISVGISSLAFFLALSAGVRGAVLDRLFPAGQLEVVPASSSLDGPLGLLSLGGPKPITADALALLTARPEVRAAYPRMRLAFPARAWGGHEFIGRDIHAELIAEGVAPEAMAGEPLAPEPFSDELGSQKSCAADGDCPQGEYCPLDAGRCERPVPAVISPFLLELYNGAIAPSHRLPKVGKFLASRFRGFTFSVGLGQSVIGLSTPLGAPPRERRVMLVGIAPRAAQLALTLPLGRVQRWNAEYAGEAAGRTFSSVLLELQPKANAASLSAAIREMGFTISDSGAERAGLALTLLTLLFALVSFAIVAVASINIAHTFFRAVAERRREIGILRSLGASSGDVQRVLLAEAAAIGLCGGASGLVLARVGGWLVDLASQRLAPEFPFKPDTWFAFGWPLVAGALGCSVAACLAGAAWPARAAARLDPAEALAAP
ncbi:MAG TPA: ABC transporter permease [Polyangia bacterium]|nr:ABC transporter permease [Polyangia bacterium]